jgi:hypothetical protein
MSVFVEICQMAVRSNEQVVVCFDEGAVSHTHHHHWIIYKNNVRMSVSVNVSYCCTSYPTHVCESKLGRDNLLELTRSIAKRREESSCCIENDVHMPIAIYVGKSDKEKLRPWEYDVAGDGQRAVGTKRAVAIADENGS